MTTTSVTVTTSTYDIGIRQVYFDGHDSTSTVGSFWSDGWCEWHVFYPGSTAADESYAGTKDFSYLCDQPGTYTFKYRATDRGGNHGSWVETTVTVQAESTANYVQYVDSVSGNNTNSGTTSGAAVQTLLKAEQNIRANWTTGGTHVVYVKHGQSRNGDPIGSGGHTAAGRIMYRPWGDAGDGRAVLQQTFGSTTCGTGQVSYVFWDVDVEFGNNSGIDLDSGFGRTIPYDFIAKDCLLTNTISGFGPRNIVEADAGERSGTDRDNDVFSLVAFEGVTVRAPDALFAFFGFSYATKIHFVDVWVDGLKVDGTSHSMRLWNVRNVYMRDCLWDAQAPTGNDIRFPTYEGAGSADATERITAHNCTIIGGQAYSHEAENALYYVRDVTFVGCQGMFSAQKGLGGHGGAWDADRIVNRNSYGHHDTIPFDLHATLGNVGSYLYEGCMRVRGFGGYSIFSFNGALSRYTGTLKFRNNIWYWEVDANPAPQIVFETASLSDSDLDAILDGDYNVAASVDANAITWVSSTSGSSSLATWVSTSGQESHSAAATSETLPITTLPGDVWDPRLTGTGGYLADKGLDDTYSLDIDGKIRVGDYPGPDDPEASTSPDVPTLAGSVTVTPGVASLTISAFAPTVTATGNLTVTPAKRSLTITEYAPSLRIEVTPSVASLSITTFVPVTGIVCTPSTTALTITRFAPVIYRLIEAGTRALTITAFAPSVDVTDADITATPGTAALAITPFAPRIGSSVVPNAASLSILGYAPTLNVKTVVAITVTPSAPTIGIGQTRQFTATATYDDDSTADLTAVCLWSSSDLSILSISNSSGSDGLATALSDGTVTVQALDEASSVSGTATATIPSIPTGGTFEFVVDDGTGLDDSNSYASVEFADAYHARFSGPAAWSSLTEAEKQSALAEATRAIDERYGARWTGGYKLLATQALQWPRAFVYWRGAPIEGIPTALKKATARGALEIAKGNDLMPARLSAASGGEVNSQTITLPGGLAKSTTYSASQSGAPQFPAIDRMLQVAGLITSSGGWYRQ